MESYLKGTKENGLIFGKDNGSGIKAYSDSDWAGCRQDRKSISGGAVFVYGNLVSWFSRKQTCVALSSTEAEYVAASLVATEVVSIKNVVQEMVKEELKPKLLIDNQGAISLAHTFENKRSKHIDLRYHFIRDIVKKNILTTEYVPTDCNVADGLTKALGATKFLDIVEKLKLK